MNQRKNEEKAKTHLKKIRLMDFGAELFCIWCRFCKHAVNGYITIAVQLAGFLWSLWKQRHRKVGPGTELLPFLLS